jgi:hypothetical protein
MGAKDRLREKHAEIKAAEQRHCQCDMRTKLVGDGCSVCNPKLAEELREPPLLELEANLPLSLGPADVVMPFATPIRLPDGKFAVVEGELELRSEAGSCAHCGTHLAARVSDIRTSDPVASRNVARRTWDIAIHKIAKWMVRQ